MFRYFADLNASYCVKTICQQKLCLVYVVVMIFEKLRHIQSNENARSRTKVYKQISCLKETEEEKQFLVVLIRASQMSLFILPTLDSICNSQNRRGKADKSYDKIEENNRITFKWSARSEKPYDDKIV